MMHFVTTFHNTSVGDRFFSDIHRYIVFIRRQQTEDAYWLLLGLIIVQTECNTAIPIVLGRSIGAPPGNPPLRPASG